MRSISSEELRGRLEAFPRVALAQLPTPLERLERLSAELGHPVYVKRDDVIGPGLGGNKTRKLEYLLGDARQQGLRRVATFGGLQSNHARLTAAAARQCGLEAHLFYFQRRPECLEGNLLLNYLLGAEMHFIPFGGSSSRGMTVEGNSRLVHALALARLGRHYFIPVGGHSPVGGLGYMQAAAEIDGQARAAGLGEAWLVTAAGSGGTLAGLMAGLALIGSRVRPVGIDVGSLWKGFPGSIAWLAEVLCRQVGETRRFEAADVPVIEHKYVGQGYAIATEAGGRALRLLARGEGIVLDPVYTAKAFAGLLDLARQGYFGKDEPLIFLHTGGLPALFA